MNKLSRAMTEVERMEEAEEPIREIQKATAAIDKFTNEIREAANSDAPSANLDAITDLMLDNRLTIELEEEAIGREFDTLKARVEALQERRKRLIKVKQAIYAWECELNRP